VTWDANVGSPIGAELTPVARIVAHDPDVAAWSMGYSNAPLRVNGISVDGIAMRQGRGPSLMAAPVQAGSRGPRARSPSARKPWPRRTPASEPPCRCR
jgi:hypothetical protein